MKYNMMEIQQKIIENFTEHAQIEYENKESFVNRNPKEDTHIRYKTKISLQTLKEYIMNILSISEIKKINNIISNLEELHKIEISKDEQIKLNIRYPTKKEWKEFYKNIDYRNESTCNAPDIITKQTKTPTTYMKTYMKTISMNTYKEKNKDKLELEKQKLNLREEKWKEKKRLEEQRLNLIKEKIEMKKTIPTISKQSNKVTLDDKDIYIIQNIKIKTQTQIAKELNISQPNVNERIEKLLKHNIIEKQI